MSIDGPSNEYRWSDVLGVRWRACGRMYSLPVAHNCLLKQSWMTPKSHAEQPSDNKYLTYIHIEDRFAIGFAIESHASVECNKNAKITFASAMRRMCWSIWKTNSFRRSVSISISVVICKRTNTMKIVHTHSTHLQRTHSHFSFVIFFLRRTYF